MPHNENDAVDQDWRIWQPRKGESFQREAQEWDEFQMWCCDWAQVTNLMVPILTPEQAAELEAKELAGDDWHARVYGGKRD